MKQKIRLVFNLIFVCFLVFFASCEAEKDFAKDTKMIVKKCSMRDLNLRSDIKLNKAVNYLKSIQTKSLQDSLNAKLVYDEKSGLFYDDEKGVYMSKDGKESYTFPVIQTDVTEKIKNITFNKNSSNEYDIYIVKYDFTKEDLNNYTKEALAEREIKYQALLRSGVEYPVEAQWHICFYTEALIALPIDNGDLTGNFGYELTWVTISSACFSGTNTGGGDSPVGNGNNNGDDSNESGGGGDIITGAVINNEAILPTSNRDNCMDLKSKSNNQEFIDKMNELKADAGGTTGEKAFETFYGTPKFSPKYSATAADPSGIQMPVPTRTDCTGFMHCHMNDPTLKNFAIFTPDDFIAQRDLIQNSTAPITSFTMYVTSQIQGVSSTFAIKITDIERFNVMAGLMEVFYDKYSKIWSKNIDEKNTPDVQVNNFLKEMQKAGFEGFELYKSDENLENWEQQTLNNSGNTIKIKC